MPTTMPRAAESDEFVVVVLNLLTQAYPVFRIGVPQPGEYAVALNTDDAKYGGSGYTVQETLTAEEITWHNCNYSVVVEMPPWAV